jgi:hypothetical protein
VTSCSLVEVYGYFGGTCYLTLLACMLFCSAYYLTLKMEKVCSSEIPVNFYQITSHHIPEGSTLHSHCSENPTSHIITTSQAQYVDSLFINVCGIAHIFVDIEFIYLILFIKARLR